MVQKKTYTSTMKNKSAVKKIKTVYKGLEFTEWQTQLIILTEDIRKQTSAPWTAKFKQMILSRIPEIKDVNHIDGSTIAKAHPSKETLRLVSELKRDPRATMSRLKLIQVIQKADREYRLEVHRGH